MLAIYMQDILILLIYIAENRIPNVLCKWCIVDGLNESGNKIIKLENKPGSERWEQHRGSYKSLVEH